MQLSDENLKKVKSCLCYYDHRNPDNDPEWDNRTDNCYCDNCHRGLTWLAELFLDTLEGKN